ncbi:VOC family protein [Bacillus sp. 03113]|uniref:VOC family protein n=1 Tax=Bacillus sp. 03113 TaxID=2578211 RepID=UPI00215C3E8B
MARPTNQHNGYDGIMLGLPNSSYHLEFTQKSEPIKIPAPTKEHLLVFYLPDMKASDQIVQRLREMGYSEAEPENPYWKCNGVTIEDPDGWRIVFMNTSGI